jgi:prevent-host-death family protein
MYNVHVKRYTVAQARQRLAEVLDTAQRGEPVVIERRGVRFVVQTERRRRRTSEGRKSVIARLDPAVASGAWTWVGSAAGLRFARRRR